MKRRIGRCVLALGLLVTTGGCMTLQPVAAPQQFVETRHPTRIWLTTDSGDRVLVQAPRIYLDSIYGFDSRGGQVWVALGDVTQAEARRTSALRTGLLFAGIGAAVVVGGTVLSGGGDSRYEEPVDVVDQARRFPWER